MPVAPRAVEAILAGLERMGLSPTRLGVRRIESDEELAELWVRTLRVSGRRSVPLELGLSLPIGEMGAIDYLAASSASIGAALTVAQGVFALVAPGVHLTIDRALHGRWRVAIVNQPPFVGQSESDLLIVGVLLSRVRSFAARPVEPVVELTEQDAGERWRALLGVPRVVLGCRRSALVFSASDWGAPVRSADPRLLALLRHVVGGEPRVADTLVVAVRALARQRLPASLTLRDAAEALGLSRRTLQRRLQVRGTSLEALVDEMRRDAAVELVESGGYTLGEIATKVGFEEQASFSRAWTRWFGLPPSRSVAAAQVRANRR